MYSPQLPQFILFFSGVLFCLASHPQTLLYGSEGSDQSTPSENAITPDNETAEKTRPHYRIRQLRFNGNSHSNEKKLIGLFGWKKEKLYTREEIIEGFERIVAGYRDEGFIFAETSPNIIAIAGTGQVNGETPVSITVEIVEGKPLRTGTLTFSGNQRFSEAEIRDQFGIKEGRLFTQVVLEQGIERIQVLYSEHGYPKIEIEPKNIQLSTRNRHHQFRVEYSGRGTGPNW